MHSYKYGNVEVELPAESMNFDSNEPCVIFRAQDSLAISALRFYRELCAVRGCESTYQTIDQAVDEFVDWASHHADRVKLPD